MRWTLLMLLLMAGAAAHGTTTQPLWQSGDIQPGDSWSHRFDGGTHAYHEGSSMISGTVAVLEGATAQRDVHIRGGIPLRFDPPQTTVAPGGTVTWHNDDGQARSVVADELADAHDREAPGLALPAAVVAVALVLWAGRRR